MNVKPFGIRCDSVLDYDQDCYIAKVLEPSEDEWGNPIPVYDTPVPYRFNVAPVLNTSSQVAFGRLATKMRVITIPRNVFDGVFHEYDLAYLEGATPEGESVNGENANYRIYSVQPQNAIIKIYFVKLVKEEENDEND